jgi:hypothetical protein
VSKHPKQTLFSILPASAWWLILSILVTLGFVYLYQLRPKPGQRDLQTPSDRLVGHWILYSPSELPSAHLFYGPIDAGEDHRGRATMIDTDGGMVFEGYYRVESQFKHGLDLTIREDLGPILQRKVTITMARDGLTGRYRYLLLESEQDQRLAYVDALNLPPEGFVQQLKQKRLKN